MASTTLGKKTKQNAVKPSLKTKTHSTAAATSPESKPSKILKRKKEEENDDISTKEPPKVSKKAKKSKTLLSKPSKVAEESDGDSEVEAAVEDLAAISIQIEETKSKKKNAKASSNATQTASTTKSAESTSEDKAKKSKKSKAARGSSIVDATAPIAPVVSSPKGSSRKSKPAQEVPTSISRPRKPDTTTLKSKSKKSKAPTPELEASASEEGDEDAEEGQESDEDSEEGHLHGFSTDEDSSDEDDAMDDETSEFDVGKLPTIAKDDATVKWKLDRAKRQPTEDRGVLFLGRLPHGFYEDQLKAYFSQFGNVTRIRVSRNKKTGRSKHYGFIEFDSSNVAEIVAETMDNYLLMGHILRCKHIPKDEVHPELWVGANRKWRAVPKDRVTRVEHNKPRTEVEQLRAAKRLLKRQQERKRKLEEAGIKYDFDAASYKKPKQVKS